MLDSSDKNYLPVLMEMEQMREYAAFECRRKERNSGLEILYQPDSDFSRVLIPTMLLQPILENSLLHGIFPLQDRLGLISIRVCKVESPVFHEFASENIRISPNGRLMVQIRDNGQGRFASNVSRHRRHTQSFGIRAINERLRWLERRYGVVAFMLSHDLTNADGSAAGTEVTFNLPLIEEM
jgi:LytS/YehU family sensor histidine kinase